MLIMPTALHPNPFIQSLQIAGVEWSWPNGALSTFWRATQETMAQAGWPRHTTPWMWCDVHGAYVAQTNGPAHLPPFCARGPRLEPCIASWLEASQAVVDEQGSMHALVAFYLSKVDPLAWDMQGAVLWASVLRFCSKNAQNGRAKELGQWCQEQEHAPQWIHAHDVVEPFALPLWEAAACIQRLAMGEHTSESFGIESLVVV